MKRSRPINKKIIPNLQEKNVEMTETKGITYYRFVVIHVWISVIITTVSLKPNIITILSFPVYPFVFGATTLSFPRSLSGNPEKKSPEYSGLFEYNNID